MVTPREAEVAGEWFLREKVGCKRTRRVVRTQWQREDFFACDVTGVGSGCDHRLPNDFGEGAKGCPDQGFRAWAQVTMGDTAGSAATARRRKIEAELWLPSDEVFLLQLVERPSPVHKARKEWFFRVSQYTTKGTAGVWIPWENAVPVPKQWFRAKGLKEAAPA